MGSTLHLIHVGEFEIMKVVILAGGLGTRLSEETSLKPKPMVEIGERPILWHIMKSYAHYGFNEFHIALGYKGEVVKRSSWDMAHLESDMRVQLGSGVVGITNREQDGHLYRVEAWAQDGFDDSTRQLAGQAGPFDLKPDQELDWRMPWAGENQQVSFFLFMDTILQFAAMADRGDSALRCL